MTSTAPTKSSETSDVAGKNWLRRILGLFLSLMGFVPLVCAFVISDFRIGCLVALAGALLNFGISFWSYRSGRTKTWPKVLDCIFLGLFGVLTVLTWTDQSRDYVYKYWSGLIINTGLVAGVITSWLFGRPFVADYMIDTIPDMDEVGLTNPVARHHVRIMTGSWLLIFILMEVALLTGAVWSLFMPEPSQSFVLAFSQPGYVNLIVLGLGMIFNIGYSKYNRREDVKLRLRKAYEKDIKEWASQNPNHKFAEIYRERIARENGYSCSPLADEA